LSKSFHYLSAEIWTLRIKIIYLTKRKYFKNKKLPLKVSSSFRLF
jgi:hypothetical protein